MEQIPFESRVVTDSVDITPRPSLRSAPRIATGSLFQRYALHMAGLVSLALLASGAIGVYFSYVDTRALVDELQREKARGAAVRIQQFMQGIEAQLRGALMSPRADAISEHGAHHFELIKLLRLAPAVSDAAWLDSEGHERVRLSRIGRDVVGSNIDRSNDPGYIAARTGRAWYGEVEFRRGTEPHLAVAVPGGRREDGVVLGAINLKFVADVIAAIRVGSSGHAYVVDAQGRLILHPDTSAVLRVTNLADLPQVRAVLNRQASLAAVEPTIIARSESGRHTLTAHAPIAGLGWHVLVEQPVSEAFAGLYGSLARSGALLLLGIGIAIGASLMLARRMTAPIHTLGTGAQRIGAGHLEERVDVRTGDELEALAGQFNRMAETLRESYAGLEQKVAERTRQLEAANNNKARFLAAASHDLRQPVHALGLFVAQLQEAHDGRERERLIEKVAASSSAVSDLIEALLDISKLDAGAVETQPTDFPLQPVLDRIEHALAPAAQAKGLRLRVRPTRLRARTDPVLFERILLNLCTNAIRYTQQGGAVVTARTRAPKLRIEVWDTGIGIPLEQRQRIFEEFYQVGDAPDPRSRGFGLGLAIVDRLAKLLGLKVMVRSIPGRGTVFAIDVPQSPVLESGPASAVQPAIAMRFDTLPVLLIDDDAIAREATEGILVQWGCRVISAASSEEALRLVKADEEIPRLIICDYRLGAGEIGTEVVRTIRAHATSEIPAVIITADAGASLRGEAAATGLQLMRKPLNVARLRAFLTHIAHPPGAPPSLGTELSPAVRSRAIVE